MNSYLLKNFPDLKVERPLFYSWPIGLRFEIGLDEIEFGDEYFKVALKRVVSIFEAIFSETDDVEIVFQQYSDERRKIRKGNFIFKQFYSLKSHEVKHSDVRNIYELDFKSGC